MTFFHTHLLSIILFTPLVGAIVLLFVSRRQEDTIRWIANVFAVLGFLVYAIVSFRRRFIELGMLRAVGLSVTQMALFLTGEQAIVILTGAGLGTVLGIAASQIFIPFLQIGSSKAAAVPPFVVQIAWNQMGTIYAVFGAMFLIAVGVLIALLIRMKVFEAVKRGVDLLGGMGRFIRPGEKILLKPNLLVGDAPEKAISPHPAVFQAVGRLAQTVTPSLSYGDSPGFGRPSTQARRPGLAAAAEMLGIPLGDFENGREIVFADSPFIKHFTLTNGAIDADGILSIAKFKTHGFMVITGAVKNQFGCIPGVHKAEFHIKTPNPFDFGKMLVCLNLYLRPRLYIVDGIVAMEGNGPRGGDPVQMNVLLLSADPIALDATEDRGETSGHEKSRSARSLRPVARPRGGAEDADRFATWVGELYLERHQGTLTTHGRNKRYNRRMEQAPAILDTRAVEQKRWESEDGRRRTLGSRALGPGAGEGLLECRNVLAVVWHDSAVRIGERVLERDWPSSARAQQQGGVHPKRADHLSPQPWRLRQLRSDVRQRRDRRNTLHLQPEVGRPCRYSLPLM